MIGKIQQTKVSKSGATIGIQVNNTWFTSKNWDLDKAVGRTIIFEPSTQSFPDGGSIQWLNDYVFEDASATPAAAAMDQRMAQGDQVHQTGPMPPQKGQPDQVNKDSLIGALALTKSITGQKEQVWEAFRWFYHKMNTFDPSEPY